MIDIQSNLGLTKFYLTKTSAQQYIIFLKNRVNIFIKNVLFNEKYFCLMNSLYIIILQ